MGLTRRRRREGSRKAKARGRVKRVDAQTRRTHCKQERAKQSKQIISIHVLEKELDDSVFIIVLLFVSLISSALL